jgi:hypothetical protein
MPSRVRAYLAYENTEHKKTIHMAYTQYLWRKFGYFRKLLERAFPGEEERAKVQLSHYTKATKMICEKYGFTMNPYLFNG